MTRHLWKAVLVMALLAGLVFILRNACLTNRAQQVRNATLETKGKKLDRHCLAVYTTLYQATQDLRDQDPESRQRAEAKFYTWPHLAFHSSRDIFMCAKRDLPRAIYDRRYTLCNHDHACLAKLADDLLAELPATDAAYGIEK